MWSQDIMIVVVIQAHVVWPFNVLLLLLREFRVNPNRLSLLFHFLYCASLYKTTSSLIWNMKIFTLVLIAHCLLVYLLRSIHWWVEAFRCNPTWLCLSSPHLNLLFRRHPVFSPRKHPVSSHLPPTYLSRVWYLAVRPLLLESANLGNKGRIRCC